LCAKISFTDLAATSVQTCIALVLKASSTPRIPVQNAIPRELQKYLTPELSHNPKMQTSSRLMRVKNHRLAGMTLMMLKLELEK
jgi:hypothetical protein